MRCGHKLGVGSLSEFILSWIGAIEELKEYVRNSELDPWDYLVAISASSKLYHKDVTEFLFHELDNELRRRKLALIELSEEQQDLFTEYFCDNQNLEALVRVLERCSFIPNQRLLSRAIDNNNYCLVEYLLREHNLVPSQMDLLVAIKCHNHAVTRLLLKKYDRPASEEHINAAIETNDLQMVGCILEKIAALTLSCMRAILTRQQDVALRAMLERVGIPTEMITSLGAMGALADAADGDGNMGRRRGVFVRRGDRL